jgi:SAM-dependent methyltransferase
MPTHAHKTQHETCYYTGERSLNSSIFLMQDEQYIEWCQRWLTQCVRVLRPGGRLVILEFAIPTAPLFRAAYLSYFRHILPRIGRAISGHDAAYGYLPASVGAFASPDTFMNLLRKYGFREVTANSLTFGSVFLYTAQRMDAGGENPEARSRRQERPAPDL